MKSTNRVGSDRLFKIGNVFGVPVSAFFNSAEHAVGKGDARSPAAMLAEPNALHLLQAFCALENDDMRRTIANLVETLLRFRRPPPPEVEASLTQLNRFLAH